MIKVTFSTEKPMTSPLTPDGFVFKELYLYKNENAIFIESEDFTDLYMDKHTNRLSYILDVDNAKVLINILTLFSSPSVEESSVALQEYKLMADYRGEIKIANYWLMSAENKKVICRETTLNFDCEHIHWYSKDSVPSSDHSSFCMEMKNEELVRFVQLLNYLTHMK